MDFTQNLIIAIIAAASGLISSFITWIYTSKHYKKNKDDCIIKDLNQKIHDLEKEKIQLLDRIGLFEEVIDSPDGEYFILKDSNRPICPVCWGKDKKPIRIYGNDAGTYNCTVCGTIKAFNKKQKLAYDKDHEYVLDRSGLDYGC